MVLIEFNVLLWKLSHASLLTNEKHCRRNMIKWVFGLVFESSFALHNILNLKTTIWSGNLASCGGILRDDDDDRSFIFGLAVKITPCYILEVNFGGNLH